jgi:hypothetical protein
MYLVLNCSLFLKGSHEEHCSHSSRPESHHQGQDQVHGVLLNIFFQLFYCNLGVSMFPLTEKTEKIREMQRC